jgi:hypothetical protein
MLNLNRLIPVIFLMMAVSLSAQDEQGAHMAPPPPVNDDFFNWMVGEWTGHSSSEMGKSTDYMKCELDLGGQFLIMTYKSETENMGGMSGIGMITLDKEGKTVGYWVDSWRTMSMGEGSLMGNKSTMNWSMGKDVYVRTTEKVDENTMRVTGHMTNAEGKEMKSESEFKRVKK